MGRTPPDNLTTNNIKKGKEKKNNKTYIEPPYSSIALLTEPELTAGGIKKEKKRQKSKENFRFFEIQQPNCIGGVGKL
jgi:hypothetical protein